MGRRLVVEADGGSRGNPGVAGYGALVRDGATGTVLVERAAPLGKESNNVAEYSGLIAGLEAAYAVDPGAEVDVAMDSKLVVEQMSGRWKIKHADMRRLALVARDLAADITDSGGSVTYRWIPREQNKAADALSNTGMDGETVHRRRTSAASPWVSLLGEDAPRTDTTDEPSEQGPTRVILVRHGITDFTAQARLDGRGGADPDLNDTGREQAASAARAVTNLVPPGEATVVTASLTRARSTGAAVAAALGVDPAVDDAWDEQNFGDWDGLAIKDIVEDDRDAFAAMRRDPAYARPGGESHQDLADRVVPAWEALLASGGTTVVVCHRKPIMVVLAHVLGLTAEAAWRLAASPGSLTALEVLPHGEVSVVFTNRT